jgi:filamentous hemagglutinin
MKKIDINIVQEQQIALLSTAPHSDLRWWQRSVAGVVAAAMLFAPFKITVDEYLSIRVGYNSAAAADPIVDPYGPLQFRPGIVNSSAGVPVINITAPNAAGMSLNQFQRFDVDAAGLILNNSLTGGGSLLGGHVAGNTNLNGRSAGLIINQIMGTGSAFASALNGMVEVFGSPASVIIANPNGISCAGCGFINTQRVTLTTGAPQFLDGGNGTSFERATALAFDVQSGRLEVGGNGIDGTLGRIDIIAETIGIDAALRAGLAGGDGQINLIAGRNRVADDGAGRYIVGATGAANTATAVKAGNPTSASVQNSFAIDGSALGAMTAGQIKIIATTAGLGVKADGALASSMGNLSISANGEIRVNSVYAKQNLELDAAGNLTVAGTTLAEQDAKLSARGNLTLSGDVQTGRKLDVDATGNAQIDASLLAKQDARLTVGGRLAQTGNTYVGGDYVVRGNGVSTMGSTSVNGAIAIYSGSDVSFSNLSTRQTLNVEAKDNIAANGTTAAVGNATIASLSGDIDARGALSTAGNLKLSAQNNIAVAGDLLALGDANINAATGSASFSGALDAAQNLILSAGQDIATAGVTKVGGAAKIDAGGNLNLGGNIVVTGALDATAKGNFANSGQTLAGGDVTLKSGGAMHLIGDVASAGNLNLSAQNDVTAARALQADANMSLTATQGSILSQGGISVGRDLSATAERDIAINGDAIIQGNSSFTATQGSAAIDGNLGVNGNLVIDARNSAGIAGNTEVLGEIDVTARTGDATFGGVVNTGNSLKVAAGRDLITNGNLGVTGNATLNAGNDLTMAGVTEVMGNTALTATSGRLLTQGDLTANGLIVYAGGDIDLRGNLGVVANAELIAGDNLITAGTVITGGNLFQRAGVDIDNNASLLVLGNLEAQAGRDARFGGDLGAAQNLQVTAGRDATFAGMAEVLGNATVQAISGDVAVRGSVAVDGATTLDAGRNITTTSVLQSGRNLNVKAVGQATLGGSTTTNQNLTVNAGSLNTQGDLSAHGTTTLTTTAGNLSNDGQLESAGDLVIVSAGDVSGNGNTLAKSNATITAQGRVDLTGSLEVAKALQIDAKNDIGLGEVSVLETASLTSRQGAIDLTGPVLTGGNLVANAKTSLQARDDVISLAAIALTAQSGPLVTNGELNAATDLTLSSGGAMIINAVAGAQRDVSLNSGANLDLNADVSATRNLAIHSNGDLTGNAKLAGINTAVVSGRDVVVQDVKSTNGTVVSATRDLTLNGEISAMRGSVWLASNGVMNNNGAVNSGSSLTVNGGAGTINNLGTLIATANTIVSAAALTNRGMIYGRNTTLNAGNVDNANGNILAKDTLTATIGNLVTIANGVIGAGDGLGGIGDLNVSASGSFNNTGGKFLATRDLSLTLPNATFDPSASGEVAAGGLLTIDAKVIANSGNWQPNAGSLSLTTQTDFSNSGTIQMDGDFRIRTSGNITNSGEILTGGTIRLDGQNVYNGNLLKTDSNVELAGNVTNRGSVQAGAAVFISGSAFDNAFGKVQSDLYLNVDVAGVLNNVGGELRSKGSANIHAASIDNDRSDPVRGWRVAGFDTGLLNSLVVGDFAWDCAWWFGMCNGANNWMDYFPGAGSRIFNTESDLLLGSLNPNYATRQLSVENPNTGVITQVNLPGTVTMGANLAPGQTGTIIADYDLTMNADAAISNRGGEIKAGRNLSITAQSLDNGRAANVINATSTGTDDADLSRFIIDLNIAFGAGQQATVRNLGKDGNPMEVMTMPTFTVNPVSPGTPGAVGNIKAGANAGLTVADLEQRGNLTAAGNLTITSSTHMNNTGATAAGGGITLHAGGLTNQPGAKIVSQGDLNIQLGSGTLTNIGGSIQSMGGNLSLNAGAVLNKDAGATDDRYVFYDLASYVNATNTLVPEDDARYRITHPESRDAGGNYLSQVFHRGSNRIALYAPDNLFLDSGQSLRTLTLVINRHESPGVISAANNLNVTATGAIDNQASVFSAGGALTAIGGSITNLGAQNMTRLKIEAGEFTHYTVQSTAASAFQAGGALSVRSGGAVVNSGNIYGQAISISGAGLTNGETNPAIAPIASITPNAVINLGDPNLGRGILDAQDIVTLATSQTVNSAGTAVANFLNGSLGSLATTAVVDPQYVMLPTPNMSAQPATLAVQVPADTPSFGSLQDPNLTGELARHGEFVQPGIDLSQTVNQRVEAMAPSAAAHVQYLNASPVSEVLAPLTPAYLLQQLPADLVNGSNLFFYADPYVEQQLLRKAALQQTGRNYFINGLAYDDQYQVSADTQQQAILYDQAAQFAKDNGIRLGLALSPELQAKLDAPMLWYVEQKVKHKGEDGSEQDITALVPQVYLPELYRQNLVNQAGGVIEGDDVSITVTGTVDNTGYLIARNKLSISAQDFIQHHRQADIGRETENIADGYVAITGTRLQPGLRSN